MKVSSFDCTSSYRNRKSRYYSFVSVILGEKERKFNPFQLLRLCLFLVRLKAGFGIFTSLKPSFQQVRIKPYLLRGPHFGAQSYFELSFLCFIIRHCVTTLIRQASGIQQGHTLVTQIKTEKNYREQKFILNPDPNQS